MTNTTQGRGQFARLLATLTLALVVLGTMAGVARADSVTINVLDTAGRQDPVTGVPRTYTVSGTTSSRSNVYIKYRAPGPTPCAATASADSGSYWNDYDDDFFSSDDRGRDANGSFSFSNVYSETLNGPQMFCIWVASDSDASVTPTTQMIDFRNPVGTIGATLTPARLNPGEQTAVSIGGVSEAPETVYATVRPLTAPCAATYDADREQVGDTSSFGDSDTVGSLVDGSSVNGNYSIPETVSESNAGDYVLCLYLTSSSSSPTPIAAQAIPFTVGSPAPPSGSGGGSGGGGAECSTARHQRNVYAARVKRTKRSLLHARRKETRRRLTRRLKAERHSLSVAQSKARVICA